MIVGKIEIEVTEVWAGSIGKTVILCNNGVPTAAMVEVYPGRIEEYYGAVKQGETDVYKFKIEDTNGFAFVFLYWYRDWTKWATSDLDLIIINPDGSLNVDGATGASPEAAMLTIGPGEYAILVDGYQVYFDKNEYYRLEIVYFADATPLWSSPLIWQPLDRRYTEWLLYGYTTQTLTRGTLEDLQISLKYQKDAETPL